MCFDDGIEREKARREAERRVKEQERRKPRPKPSAPGSDGLAVVHAADIRRFVQMMAARGNPNVITRTVGGVSHPWWRRGQVTVRGWVVSEGTNFYGGTDYGLFVSTDARVFYHLMKYDGKEYTHDRRSQEGGEALLFARRIQNGNTTVPSVLTASDLSATLVRSGAA